MAGRRGPRPRRVGKAKRAHHQRLTRRYLLVGTALRAFAHPTSSSLHSSWPGLTHARPARIVLSCRLLQLEAIACRATTLRRPGGGWLEVEFDLVWCWALRGFFLKKSSNRSPMHEIGADQPGESKRTFHDGVGVVSQAQQQEGDQGNRDLNTDGIFGGSEEVGDLQGLLDPSKERRLYRSAMS
jgi:hypothetical protein